MKRKVHLLFALACIMLSACGTSRKVQIHDLPDDLTSISSEQLDPLKPMIGDAKIIGVTECVHDFIEPFHFRNALIKKLVEEQSIGVIAIESGLPESKLCYDYILGKDIPIDSVLLNGLSCTFGSIDANKELLVWLRKYNMDKPSSEQVHFYGFDIPGCAPNPVLENAKAGFKYVQDYLDEIDKEEGERYRQSIEPYEVYLRIKDNSQDSLPHFWDLDSLGWNNLELILDDLESTFQRNAENYVKESSELEYQWAYRSIHSARQNVIFFRSIGDPEFDYDSRDFGQFENIQWIMRNEPDKKVLLFAHSTHLLKEIHSNSATLIPYPRCGEYLADEYGDDYVVIGNFFRKLDWFDDDPLELGEGFLGYELSKLGAKNYYLDVDMLDADWYKEWSVRKSNSGGELRINLGESVDIIYFNDTQTTLFPGE